MSIKEKVLRDIALERTRQISAEGYTIAHDDAHDPGELAAAGACYGMNAADQLHPYSWGGGDNEQPIMWPWAPEAWKPKTPREDLVRAAALIVAEIEKLDRCG